MEYGYALITPQGCKNDCVVKMIKKLIQDKQYSDIKTLIGVYDFDEPDYEKLSKNADNLEFSVQLRKNMSEKTIGIIFAQGFDVNQKLKQIAIECNQKGFSPNKKERYLDNVYVSNDTKEAIEDFCEYTDIDLETFEKIKEEIFTEQDNAIISFNFKTLTNYKKR